MSFKQVAQFQLDYTMWASSRLVVAAGALSADELTRDFGTADKSVLGTLLHIFAADRLWWRRLNQMEVLPFIRDEERRLEVLQSEWSAVLYDWKLWAARTSDEAFAADLTYTDLRGGQWTMPLWHVLNHLVNHGTHHRGQVSGFLRALGKTPPPIDVMVFCREMKQTAPPMVTPSA